MKPPSDPPHLLDPPRLVESGESTGPSVVAALEAGRSRLPDAARFEAIARALAAKTTPPGNGGGQGAPRAALRATKIAAGAVAGVAAIAAAWLALPRAGDPRIEPANAGMTRTPETPHLEIPSASPAPAASASNAIPTMDIDSLPVAATHDAGAIARPHAPTEPAETEVHLLARAQDALASDPDDALHLCAEHERRFPHGNFVEEREVIAIDALVRLSRREDANARGDRFLQSHPGSADARRVRRLLGAD